jgi:D-mannonate dehydratase
MKLTMVANPPTTNNGYMMQGHIFALGYLRGLVQSIERGG